VLATMLDALVVRAVLDSAGLSAFSAGGMAVVNAMSSDEHPTQAIGDLATMQQRFGGLEGLRVLYMGEGNSTAVALCHALRRYAGVELFLRTPAEYGLPVSVPADGIDERHDMDVAGLPGEIDVVYTTRWQTTGTSKRHDDWRDRFAPYQVNEGVMDRYPGAFFMHDLPAHRGDEVTGAVLDGPRSIVIPQAANKLYSAMAALEWCLGVS
jgi:ornithine carbamoyltransferase